MSNVFLLQDMGVFELHVDASNGPPVDEAVREVLSQLPQGAASMVDLRMVTVERVELARLAEVVSGRREDGVRVVAVVGSDEQAELVAESMDESWYGIARDPEQARAMLSNPALAAAS